MTHARKTTPETALLKIDFPLAGEIVTAPYYTFRADVSAAANVALSIDESGWSPCRFSMGYWWHDWSGYESGYHQVRAQAFDAEGNVIAIDFRRVEVRLSRFDESPRREGRHGRRA